MTRLPARAESAPSLSQWGKQEYFIAPSPNDAIALPPEKLSLPPFTDTLPTSRKFAGVACALPRTARSTIVRDDRFLYGAGASAAQPAKKGGAHKNRLHQGNAKRLAIGAALSILHLSPSPCRLLHEFLHGAEQGLVARMVLEGGTARFPSPHPSFPAPRAPPPDGPRFPGSGFIPNACCR